MNFSSKLIEQAVEAFASLPGIGRKTALRLTLHLVGEWQDSECAGDADYVALRKATNVIWYELLSAARTDAALRAATIDVLAHHSRATRETAIAAFSLVHPELDHDDARALVVAALAMFDGEAIVNLVNPTPEFDELVERALRVVAGLLAEHATTRIATGQPSSRVEAAGTAAETLGRSV